MSRAKEPVTTTNLSRLSSRATRLPRSSIRRLFNAALALQREGYEVIRLDIGDPNLRTPARIIDGIEGALGAGQTRYSPMPGIPGLRKAIASHMSDRKGIATGHTRIVVTQGATQALNSALQLTCDAGDEILLPEVYFPNYVQQTTLAGVRPGFYRLNRRFEPELDELERYASPATRALLINSPGNPTGALFSGEAVERLYSLARERNWWIISDEAYTDYVFGGQHLSPLHLDQTYPEEERRVIGVYSFSKSFAVTGLRMGWMVAPRPEVASAMALMNEPLTGSLTTPLQWGMVRALEEDDTGARRRKLLGLRDTACQLLQAAGIEAEPPAGGMFYFLDISSSGMTGDQFADRLLAEEKVAVVPGSGFGLKPASDGTMRPGERADNCVRLCFAVPKHDLQTGIPRLAAFLNQNRRASQTGQ